MIDLLNTDCRHCEWQGWLGDVMITDPPYRAHVHKNATSNSPGRGVRSRDMGFEHLTPELRRFTCQLAASVKRWSLIYSDMESATWWRLGLEAAGATYIRTIPWVRWSMPQLSGDRPPQGCELLILAWGKGGGRKSWNGPGNLTHLSHLALRGESKHKAEKPLDQVLDIVSWFSNEGEMVIDPFAGHGTVGLACKMTRREYVGCEVDSEWYAKANARITSSDLSDRDFERYHRWEESTAKLNVERVRMAANTAKTRARLEARSK